MLDPAITLSIFQRQPEPKSFSAGDVNQRAVETLHCGEVFGVGALVSTGPRPYTAIAKTACKLAFLDEKRFLFVVQETPLFALQVMKSYSERLNRLTHMIQ
jgi:CRP/FNR family transcriptional regulator, cyclic AMP receptor protein